VLDTTINGEYKEDGELKSFFSPLRGLKFLWQEQSQGRGPRGLMLFSRSENSLKNSKMQKSSLFLKNSNILWKKAGKFQIE